MASGRGDNMIEVVGDFETRSMVSLKDTNSFRYARHSSTEVLCFSFQYEDEYEPQLWTPGEPFSFNDDWHNVKILSFNAEFEWNIWNGCCVRKYGWPVLDDWQIECLQARASYAGLPRKLEQVSKALSLGKSGKDAEGHAIMLKLCKPKRAKLVGCLYQGGEFDNDPEKHEANYRYCEKDVIAEKLVARLAPPLPPFEQKLWQVHRKINERGVPVDMPMIRSAAFMAQREAVKLNHELFKLSGEKVKSHNCLTKGKSGWLWMKELGVDLPDLQENTLNDALAGKHGQIPKEVTRALEIRQLCRNSGAAKFAAMQNHAASDGRCRGAHIFYKAGPGRWAGAGVNFLNLPRLAKKEIDWLIALADEISEALDPLAVYKKLQDSPLGVIPTLAKLPRLAVGGHKGKKLIVCDYSSIEYRKMMWLADDRLELKLIRDFDNGIGIEPYILAGAEILGIKAADVDDDGRQLGKVQKLGCIYLQGAENLKNFAFNTYGVVLTHEQAYDIVQGFRRKHIAVKKFWYRTQDAAITAIKHRKKTSSGPIDFYMTGNTLNARLPSGRELKFYAASVVDGPFGPEVEALDQRSGRRKAVSLPVLIENLDQGSSRDLLADALMKCEAENLPVVLHVYDEIVLEVPEDDDESGKILAQIMTEAPSWAKGLPVAAKSDSHRRYIK